MFDLERIAREDSAARACGWFDRTEEGPHLREQNERLRRRQQWHKLLDREEHTEGDENDD